MNIYTTGVGFSIWFAYWSKATPFSGEACETNCKNEKLLEGRLAKQFCRTVHSHLTSFSMVPVCLGHCVGVWPTIALIGDARQATDNEKSSPVKIRLTGLAATALLVI